MILVSLNPRNGSNAQAGTIQFHGGYVHQGDGKLRIFLSGCKDIPAFTVLNPAGFVSREVIEQIARCVIQRQVIGQTDEYEWLATIP